MSGELASCEPPSVECGLLQDYLIPELRLAIVRDFRAELWPSMDLCADELLAHLPSDVHGIEVHPPFCHLLGSLPLSSRLSFNADRFINRHLLLARQVRRLGGDADFFHITDHSYAHLALCLPSDRVGVYCHDLDAIRCLCQPDDDPRPSWFRLLARRTLMGLRRAAVVFHNSVEVGQQLVANHIVEPGRLVHAPLGVASEFIADVSSQMPGGIAHPYLLHVGGELPRKRLDVLLDIFAAVRNRHPEMVLVQVGQPWSRERCYQIDQLGLGNSVLKFSGLSRPELASLYRGALAVLVTSESEGFGLPVIEALACGAIVVASDISVLREVGGSAVLYAPVANVPYWLRLIEGLCSQSISLPTREDRLTWVRQYSWKNHAATIVDAYQRLASRQHIRLRG